MTCRPGHAPRHPPFAEGNTAHLVHGADSARLIAEWAQQAHARLLEEVPYLAEPKFLPATDRYLRACRREELLHAFIEQTVEGKGPRAVPVRAWEQATAAARLAQKLADDLGLTPVGHARIRALTAGAAATEATLAELAEEGRAIRERRDAAGIAESSRRRDRSS